MVEMTPQRCIVLDSSNESILVSSNGIKTVSVTFALLLVLFFGCFASSASAGINQWTRIGPEGGEVRALAIDPRNPATVYAGTGEGVFKSSDGGTSWQAADSELPGANVRALVIDPRNPATVYAGTMSGVFKSTNGGASWQAASIRVPPAASIYALAIDPLSPATIYAVIDVRGVFKSTNGGASWQDLRNRFIYALAIDPLDPATVYAGGESEEKIVRLLQDARERGIVVVAASSEEKIDPLRLRPATVYAGDYRYKISKSTNGGANWHAANTGLPDLRIYALAIDPLNPATVYAGTTGGGVFKSTDSGASWQAENTGLTDLQIRALAIDPVNPATVYVVTQGASAFKITFAGKKLIKGSESFENRSQGENKSVPLNSSLPNNSVETDAPNSGAPLTSGR